MHQNAACEGPRDSGYARLLASQGRHGDTLVAHISPLEAAILRLLGGAGTINPMTGIREFYMSGTVGAADRGAANAGSALGGGTMGRGGKTAGGTNDGSGGSGTSSQGRTNSGGVHGSTSANGLGGANDGTGVKGGITGGIDTSRNQNDKIGADANAGTNKTTNTAAAASQARYDKSHPYGGPWGQAAHVLKEAGLGALKSILGGDPSPVGLGVGVASGLVSGLDDIGTFTHDPNEKGSKRQGGSIGGMGGGRGDSGSLPGNHATIAQNAQQANAGGGLLAMLNPAPPMPAPTSPALPAGLLQYLAQNPGLLQGLVTQSRFGTGSIAPISYMRPYP